MIKTPFPKIHISGRPYERGYQYGRLAVNYLKHSLAAYRTIFDYYTAWQGEQIRVHAMNYLPAIGNFRPHLVDEMQGIADGAGVHLADILAINVRTEILNAAFARKATSECTAFFTGSASNGTHQILLGQNWDWKPATAKSVVILEVAPDQGPNFVTVVEAGLLAKTGMNASGIGLVTNALATDLDRDQPGVPYHIVLRSILEATTFENATELMQNMTRASAANYLIASRAGQALDLEAGPGQEEDNLFLQPINSSYIHTNHFQCASPSFLDVGLLQGPDSPIREQRLQNLLQDFGNELTVEAIKTALGDHYNHPFGICCHPDDSRPAAEQYATIASIIMDLTAHKIWLANGNPCQAQYQQLDYKEFLAG